MSNEALKLGQKMTGFSSPATSKTTFNLSDYTDKSNLVVYFYPKDSTPGCTTEGQNFSVLYDQFQALDTEIVGVSRDSLRRHENFKTKYAFPFELLSDEEGEVCRQFGVWQLKKTFGKEYMGIIRSTFLLDKQGVLQREWLNVRVKGHVDAVLQAVKEL
jgi:peroxiredoxin Q/BCP